MIEPFCLRGSAVDSRRRRDFCRSKTLRLESLESRSLLSASSALDGIFAQPNLNLLAVTNTTPQGYTPSQIRQAYGFNGISFNGGAVPANGSGQTIAIVDAYDDPNIVSDLHAFDQTFGLADPPSFAKLNQNAGTNLPSASASWSQEIALDVEWAHAMAPGASILLVEANSSSLSDLLAAVNVARNAKGVSVVSMSWGSGEFNSETQYDQYFTTPSGHNGITFVASAGDSGAGAMWPAISPNVLSVGGTSLSLSSSGYGSESAWSGSGGGYSRFESEPGFQQGVQSSGVRTSPDVAYDANPNTGVAVFDSLAINGRSGWFQIGGTSAGAPQWAALFALVDQGRVVAGQGSLAGGQSSIYNLPGTALHDVTAGSNGYSAQPGYDLVTGRGSPIASAVVANLVSNTTVTTSGPTPTPTPTPTPAPSHHHYYEIVYWNHRWWLVEITTNAVDGSSPTTTQADQSVDPVSSALADSRTIDSQFPDARGAATRPINAAVQTTATAIAGANMAIAGGLMDPSVPGSLGDSAIPNDDPSIESDATDRQNESDDVDSGAPIRDDKIKASGEERPEPAGSAEVAQDFGLNVERLATPALAPAHDACFASESWESSLKDALVALPDQVTGTWDLDLTITAIALAAAVHCGQRPSEGQQSKMSRPRRPLTRVERD